MRILVFSLALFAFVGCKPSQKNSGSNDTQKTTEVSEASPASDDEEDGLMTIDWQKLTQYKLIVKRDSDATFAVRQKWSFTYKIYFENGVLMRGKSSLSKAEDSVSCEVTLEPTIWKSRRKLKEKEEVKFNDASDTWNSIYNIFGYSQGSAEAEAGTRVKRIECKKYSTDGIFVQDLQTAFGSYISISAR